LGAPLNHPTWNNQVLLVKSPKTFCQAEYSAGGGLRLSAGLSGMLNIDVSQISGEAVFFISSGESSPLCSKMTSISFASAVAIEVQECVAASASCSLVKSDYNRIVLIKADARCQ
jgi:hypothetical protein